MGPRIPLATALAAALAGSACATTPPADAPGPEYASPRLHHLLDLEDARAPLTELDPFLRDPDPWVRARASLAVARKGGEGAAAMLRQAVRDPDSRVREAAAFGMGLTDDAALAGDALGAVREAGAAAASAAVRLGGKRVWEEAGFTALFRDEDFVVRRAAYMALPAAVRGWKEKPPIDGVFANGLLKADEADPIVVVSAAILVRSLLTPVLARESPAPLGDLSVFAAAKAHLASTDPDARAACGRLLAAAVGSTESLATEPEGRVRAAILFGLARRRDPETLAALIRSLREDSDFGARASAALAIGARGESAAGALGALGEAIGTDASRLVRVEAMNAMHLVGAKDALTITVNPAMTDPFLRAAAAGRLTSGMDLARLARDPEIRVRESAVTAAGERGRDGFDLCLLAIQDTDPVVAANAASGLGAMGPREPDPKAKEAPPPPMDAAQVAEAIAALEAALAAHPAPAVAPDDWADLRASVIDALGKLKAPEAPSVARDLLGDPDPTVRETAARVLEEIEKKKPEMPIPGRLLPFVERADLRVVDEGAARVRIETDRGTLVVQTLPSAAPVHVARFLARVRAGGYDGTVFHRIVPAFVVQGGDPRGDGSGNGGAPTRQEFSPVPYRRGTLGVPRSNHPDSGGCQLFFCHGETPHLDQRYTVMGEIVEGVEVLDRIDLGDRIIRATVETAY